jgi:hypothetical protein
LLSGSFEPRGERRHRVKGLTVVWSRAAIAILLIAAVFCVDSFTPSTLKAQAVSDTNPHGNQRATAWPQTLHMADFILKLQTADGAIPDRPGVTTVNEDSNMEYALIGLAAAYAASKDRRYLDGVERGIQWLAAREEMNDPRWNGSWRYVYSSVPPFPSIPTSPGAGITDVRGVDATCALFAYLLYLHQRLTGSDTLARTYAANAKAALDFVVQHNLDKDGFSQSSWQQHASDGQWHLYAFKYSADQGDVYLGMRAGGLLYHVSEYERVARFLKESTPTRLFAKEEGRYGLGLNENGTLELRQYVFAQGYLAWMWGDTPENRQAVAWLCSKVRPDGSLVEASGKPAESLSVAVLSMGDAALGHPEPSQSFRWLVTQPYDPAAGGVHETAQSTAYEYDNVAGFCVIGLLGFLPFD